MVCGGINRFRISKRTAVLRLAVIIFLAIAGGSLLLPYAAQAVPLPDMRPTTDTPFDTAANPEPESEQESEAEATSQPEGKIASVPTLRPNIPGDSPSQSAIPLPQQRPADPPLPSQLVSSEDYFLLHRILVLLKEDSFVAAQSQMQSLTDPLAKDVAEWLYIRDRSLHAGYQRIRKFIASHADWPNQSLLHKRIEVALFISRPSAQIVIDYFADRTPVTGHGMVALARAFLKKGKKDEAANYIRMAWTQHLFAHSSERIILREFSEILHQEDHLARLRYLLYRKRKPAAQRAARLAGTYGAALIAAHNTIGGRTRRARQAYVRTPEAIKQDPILVLRLAQVFRRAGKNREAAALLIAAMPQGQDQINAHGWWPERRLLVRRMITAKRPDLAYKLAAHHNVTDKLFLAEAEFLAGWVALRYLYDSDLAYFHFRKLRKSVQRPLSIARAEYWLGRTEEMRGNQSSAIIRYANAEQYPYTFYGQMAMTALKRDDLIIPPATTPSQEEKIAFDALDLTKAAILFHDLGEHRHSRRFLVQNARIHDNGSVAALSAELAESHGRPDTALRIGKVALARDELLYQAAHTLNGLPEDYDQVSGLEPALIYAVSRQESAFDIAAISHAGARGLMQLMPPTAREVSGELNLEYSLARLTNDPSYNVTLGSIYLENLIIRFDGSYVMAIPGYNAGGGRVNRWTKVFGDPRDPLQDPVDWIERMPLSEPRNYVQRVLANLQIYRAILAGGSHRLELLNDIQRGVRTMP